VTEDNDLIAGRYRLLAQVGTGGMGVVWRARDDVLGRTVALKELTAHSVLAAAGAGLEDEGSRRAMREARIAARLHHPNVIGVYDIVEHEGRPFLVMEFLASRSLAQLMAAGVRLPPQETARIGVQLASALDAAHDAGIVHRDVKPGNVLLAEDGAVKLTDFGISRAVGDTTVTASGVLLGTLGYIAPEVAQGQTADSRSDVYSLGATLYAAVEGQPPFGTDDNAVAMLYRIVHGDLIPARQAGPLEPALLWMLDRDPQRRPTMQQVRQALKAVESAASMPAAASTEPIETPAQASAPAAAEGAAPTQTAPRDRSVSGKRRHAALAMLAAALLLGLGGWALVASLSHHTTPRAADSHTSAGSSAVSSPSLVASASPRPPSTAASNSPASAAATSKAPPSAPQSRTAQLASTIVDYYHLMPGNLAQGWTWMTPDYQQHHAGGWSGYQSFWSQVQRVAASNVTASAPSTVTATVDYYYKNGSFVEERTLYGLVFQQGRWLIASSSVLSHRGA
jgi:serine/threonine protein kinase